MSGYITDGRGDRPLPHDQRDFSPAEEQDIGGLDLGTASRVLVRRAWLVLGLGVIAFGLAWFLVPKDGAAYSSTAVVRLSDAPTAMAGGMLGIGATDNVGASDFIVSQIHVIRSRAVVGQVVDQEGLQLRPLGGISAVGLVDTHVSATAPTETLTLDFGGDGYTVQMGSQRVRASYGEVVQLDGVQFSVAGQPEQDRWNLEVVTRERAIDDALVRVAGSPRDRASIIDIHYSDPNPVRAQRVVNGVAAAFQSHNMRTVQQKSQRRRVFIEEQLGQTEAQLADAQTALGLFRTQERLYSSREKLASEQAGLMNLEVRREEMDAERRMLQGLLARVDRTRGAEREEGIRTMVSAPGISSNPVVGNIHGRLVQYQAERDNLSTGTWGRSQSHPDVERLNSLIATAERDLASAVRSHIMSLDARVRSLDDLRGRSATTIRGLPEAEMEETRLAQEVETIGRMADLLREEYQKARIAEAVEEGQVEILDLASTASPQQGGRRKQMLGISLVLGLMLGSGGALLMETTNRSIRHRDEMDAVLRVPSLAVLPPSASTKADRVGVRKFVPGQNGNGSGSSMAVVETGAKSLVTVSDVQSGSAEAFRVLRTNLSWLKVGDSLKTLVVTSAGEGEGKSTTVANLAVTFARQGMRVLVIDADLRRPRLHKLFGISREPGLSDLILGRNTPEEVIQSTDVKRLFLLPAGVLDMEAMEQLGSPLIRQMLQRFGEGFDLIVLDSPPVLAAADAANLGSAADGVLLVVRAGTTEKGAARRAIVQLAAAGGRLVGSVLNDPDATVEKYGEHYYPSYYPVEA
ncbi:hypothetical protein BH23GEM6_BH23GEM6_18220 [soil metagenome]